MTTQSELAYENRDFAYAVIAPAYDVVARFVPRWISPNHLTMLGLGCAFVLMVVMQAWPAPEACLVAAFLVMGYELCDSLDGKHARNTGRASRFGAYLDTAVDGLAAGLMYTAVIGHFKLFTPIFVLVIGLRMAKACMVYASAAETRLRINPEIGTTVENLLFTGTLLAMWAWPNAGLDVASWFGSNEAARQWLAAFQLDRIDPIRALMLLLTFLLPITSVGDVLEVKKLLSEETPT